MIYLISGYLNNLNEELTFKFYKYIGLERRVSHYNNKCTIQPWG
jgi:hypothetical protein